MVSSSAPAGAPLAASRLASIRQCRGNGISTSDRLRERIISWAVDFPGYNIGAVHGQASGTVVLDWDGDDGWESRRQLERELGELPATPAIITGSGGEHQLFRHPGRHIPTNKGLRPGFDVRGDGGFSVLAAVTALSGSHLRVGCRSAHRRPATGGPAGGMGRVHRRHVVTSSSSSSCNTSGEIVWTPAPTARHWCAMAARPSCGIASGGRSARWNGG